MNKSLWLEGLVFVTIWWAVYSGVMIVLRPLGFDQLYGFPLLACFFGGVGVIALLLLSAASPPQYLHQTTSSGRDQLPLLAIQIVTWLALGVAVNHFWPLSHDRFDEIMSKQFYFPLLAPATLVTKICDVFCQQCMLFLFVQRSAAANRKNTHTIGLIALMFFIVHLPLLYFAPHLGRIVFVPSLIAGGAFAYLLLKPRWGLNLSFALHFSFYMVVGLWLRLY